MTQWTEEPIAKKTRGQGKHDKTWTITKLQNKRHENKNMEQNQKQTLQK